MHLPLKILQLKILTITLQRLLLACSFDGSAYKFRPEVHIFKGLQYLIKDLIIHIRSIGLIQVTDNPPTTYVSGRGAFIDGQNIASSSLEAGMLFNVVTFFTPDQKGVILTNGALIQIMHMLPLLCI